ncbi:hypothetical protein CROQUDRAFT_512315 [Cronartium quercuum f. sp. fusiforme G11]|uniref:Uncharacterized protein n=1 Tax=Cronartium quercuum f. sp. fusiforme G11 TaxID=708437 RepID=A0A9P6TCF5_9BASI|nr:hypothetical protein CROQUDRAFT_512315 [Cronartium quercuum f. sp. fusiforme G11]
MTHNILLSILPTLDFASHLQAGSIDGFKFGFFFVFLFQTVHQSPCDRNSNSGAYQVSLTKSHLALKPPRLPKYCYWKSLSLSSRLSGVSRVRTLRMTLHAYYRESQGSLSLSFSLSTPGDSCTINPTHALKIHNLEHSIEIVLKEVVGLGFPNTPPEDQSRYTLKSQDITKFEELTLG